MKKIIFSFLLAAGLSYAADAQQDATYNMYLFNALYINPAAAGSQDVLNLVGVFRDQWAGFDGAPRTVNVSADAPLRRDQYALGLTLSNDRLGLTNSFSATAAFAYRIKINRKNIIALGVQGGFTNYQQRDNEATLGSTSAVDAAFSVKQNLWLPNIGAGIYAYGQRYYIGFSVPHLLPFSLDNKWSVTTSPALAHLYNQYLLTGGYVFGKDASIVKFRPSFLMTYEHGLTSNVPDFDFNLGLLFIDRIWLIGGVTTGSEANNIINPQPDNGTIRKFDVEGAIIMVQAKLTPQLSVGYGYHYSISPLRSYETGTHEIMLGYQFWYDKKRFVTPRYVKYF